MDALRGQLGAASVGESCLSGCLDGPVEGGRSSGALRSTQEVAPWAQVRGSGACHSTADAGAS
eukprot:4431900-Alexandrium_andersonii.AAC.1